MRNFFYEYFVPKIQINEFIEGHKIFIERHEKLPDFSIPRAIYFKSC